MYGREVDNKKLNPSRRVRAMWFRIVGNLIAYARSKDKLSSVGKLGMEFPFQA